MSTTTERILVTGATGFIGRELVRQLLAAGHTVNTHSRTTSNAFPNTSENSQLQFVGDICDRDGLVRACDGVETIYHLAGIAHVNSQDAQAMTTTNVHGTEALIAAARQAGVKHVVFISSSLAATAQNRASSDKHTLSAYARSKWQAEQLLLDAHAQGVLDVRILRPVNVYGVGMKGNIARMIELIDKRRLPPLPRLKNSISMIGVLDLCRAAICVAGAASANGKTFCVTDGLEYNINAIEQAIYAAVSRKKPGWHTPRMVFYAAAAFAELATKTRLVKTDFGLRSYRNLVSDNIFPDELASAGLGFFPSTNFYEQLPAIVSQSRKQTAR